MNASGIICSNCYRRIITPRSSGHAVAQLRQRVWLNMSPDNLARDDAHYQYNDPITLKLQAHREPTLGPRSCHSAT